MKLGTLPLHSLIISSVLFYFSACSSDPQQPQGEKLVTTDVLLEEGTNMAIALSPDSTTLALDLQGTIWVMPATGGKATAITDGMGDCHEPAWSPDGKQISFHSYKGGNYHIWTVQKDGSQLKQITHGKFDDREPHWSPDGSSIIFSSDRNGNYDIWKADLGTGNIEALTDDSANEYNPSYAPDGSTIAYVSEHKEQPGIYLMDANGMEQRLLAGSDLRLATPSWSPDQQTLSFTAFDSKSSHLVYHQLNKSDTAQVLSSDEDIFPFRAAWISDQEFLYTADGKIKQRSIGQEGFSTIPMEATVQLQRFAYDRKTYDFNDTTSQPALGLMGPVISPDGQTVAFTAMGDIWLKPLEGKAYPMTNDRFVDINPCWSPDGDKVAFLSDRDGNMDLWIHTLSSGQSEKLVDLEKDLGFPDWSPDGKSIAYFARDMNNVWGGGELQIVDVESGDINALETTYFVPSKPSWSPDSQTLAIIVLQASSSRYREGLSQIMLISREGEVIDYVSPEEDRTPAIRNANGPAWSPDGKHMAYIQDGILWALPVDEQGLPDGTPQALTEELASSPSWTGDSQQILYLATDTLKLINISTKKTQAIPLELYWKQEMHEGSYVVHAGRLFNGLDSSYHENVDILVEGNRIKKISAHQDDYDVPVIDASDKTIIPGLFEMHSHQHATAGEKLGRTWLAYGITNVREPGADPYDALERKEAWASGQRPGPREFFTGGLTDGGRIFYGLANSVIHGPHMALELERAERLGYDLIKTYVRLPDSLQKVITEGAHKIGIPVSSHEIYPAMRYNVDAVEHILGTSRRGYSTKQSNLKATYNDVIQLLVKSQMNITPTIGLQGGFYILGDKNPDIYENRQLNVFYPEQYVIQLKTAVKRFNRIAPAYLQNFEAAQKAVYDIVNAGGRVTVGTDSPFIPYGTSFHVELQVLVDAGLTPFQTLQAATLKAAEAIGVAEDLGSIEEGKLADFVIIDGDPLHRIEDSWNIESTFKGGVRYDIDDLLQRPSL